MVGHCNAYIGCRYSRHDYLPWKFTKKLTLYPPTKPTTDQDMPIWIGNEDSDDESVQQLLTLDQALSFKDQTKDDLINTFITNSCSSQLPTFQFFSYILDCYCS
jgi:hypothetical protein